MSEIRTETLGWVFIGGCVLLMNYVFHAISPEVVSYRWAFVAGCFVMNGMGLAAGLWWADYWGTLGRGMGWFAVGIEVVITVWQRRRRPHAVVPRARFNALFDTKFDDNAWAVFWISPKADLQRWYEDQHGFGVDNMMEIRPFVWKKPARDVYVFFKTWDDAFHFKLRWL